MRLFVGILRRALVAGIFGIGVAGPATAWAQSDQEKLAAGTWYGELSQGPDKPAQKFLTTRANDGSYTLQVRVYEKDKAVTELRNQGRWGISNGLYFTVTTEINGQPADFRNPNVANPYWVRSLSQDVFEYQHMPSGTFFRVVRVNPDTVRLPD